MQLLFTLVNIFHEILHDLIPQSLRDLSWPVSADICKKSQMDAIQSLLVGKSVVLENKCYLNKLYIPEYLQDPNYVHSMLN